MTKFFLISFAAARGPTRECWRWLQCCLSGAVPARWRGMSAALLLPGGVKSSVCFSQLRAFLAESNVENESHSRSLLRGSVHHNMMSAV